MAKTDNGNGEHPKRVDPFKLDRDGVGVMHGFMEISERVMNGEVEVSQAKAATGALSAGTAWVKTQLDALRMFEKGSSATVRQEAAKLIGMPTQHQALEDGTKG